MDLAGALLCGVLVGADYGSTHYALKQPGTREVGPIAKHSLPLGAGIKGGACLVVEETSKGSKKRKWIMRGVMVLGTGALVANNLRQAELAKRRMGR